MSSWGRNSSAHEGHAALPTKGLTVAGDQLLLSEGAREAIDLQTGKVTLADMARFVECNAHVVAPWRMQAMVTTQARGRIGRLFVRPGDRVEAGQELASVESLELEALQLAMLQADAELRLAKEKLTRQLPLAERGVIAGSEALETEASVRQRTAELEVAQCKLRAIGLSQALLDRVRQSQQPVTEFALVSPLTGVIAEADVRVGQVVKTTEHLFHIVDRSRVWVVGDVLEGEVAAVQPGQPAVVRFKELPDRVFRGVVDHLHLKMDETRRTRHVAVAIDNTSGLLSPGMFGQMRIETALSKEAVVCPTEGIIRYFGSEYALVNRGEGKYVRSPVETGLRQDDRVEILDGLFPGDRVVVNGNHVLFSLFANETPASSGSRTPPRIEAQLEAKSNGPAAPKPVVIQGVVELPTDRKALSSARLEGRIGRILVDHSQPVKAGQVLAEVESLHLRNLQGELLESQSKLAWTRDRVESLERLATQNVLSKKELWQLQTAQRVLENQVESIARRLGMLGVAQDDVDRILAVDLSAEDCDVSLVRSVPIRAAIDGEVAAFDVVPGQIVNAEKQLFEVHDRSKVWVKGYVFQRDATGVVVGQPVSVTFHALPGVQVGGRVVRVSPVLDRGERVLPVWVEVDNSDGRLIEGMLARIEINRAEVAVVRGRRLDSAR
ncbi:efflux RND transporter periplasmic adaptor subunit [Botrimarina sp.]|uniref:efflux RND transporter periplasmic adaptor subunit n=1 Tax=Botrimarina sp. TaxID=2795802 RepID=UPI0032F07EB1